MPEDKCKLEEMKKLLKNFECKITVRDGVVVKIEKITTETEITR